jgi:hypothetical protein
VDFSGSCDGFARVEAFRGVRLEPLHYFICGYAPRRTPPQRISVVAARAGGLLNFADPSRTIALPQTTLKRYFALLEDERVRRSPLEASGRGRAILPVAGWLAEFADGLEEAFAVNRLETGPGKFGSPAL